MRHIHLHTYVYVYIYMYIFICMYIYNTYTCHHLSERTWPGTSRAPWLRHAKAQRKLGLGLLPASRAHVCLRSAYGQKPSHALARFARRPGSLTCLSEVRSACGQQPSHALFAIPDMYVYIYIYICIYTYEGCVTPAPVSAACITTHMCTLYTLHYTVYTLFYILDFTYTVH